MANSNGSSSIYLLPGMRAKLTAPGFFVATSMRKKMLATGQQETVSLVNGFAVDDVEVGDIEPVENEPAVIYTHKKFGHNKIMFYARSGEVGELHVIAVPIHDHSSIVAGGPAYATFFTDQEDVS